MSRIVARAFIVIVFSVISLSVIAPAILIPYPTAYTGLHAGPTGTTPEQAHIVVDRGSPAYRAGLRSGDRVGCMSLRDSEILFPQFDLTRYQPWLVRACAIRQETLQYVAFQEQPGPMSKDQYGSTLLGALRILAYAVFLIVGCMLVVARSGLMTWVLYVYCLFTVPAAAAIESLTTLPATAYALVLGSFSGATFLSSPFLLLFALIVPDTTVPKNWRGRLFWAMCAVVAALIVYHAYGLSHTSSFVSFDTFANATFTRSLTYVVIVVTLARLVTMRQSERARFGWVAFALIIGVVANDLRSLLGGSVISGVGGILTMLMPLALMYAILRQHVIDVRFVISRAVVYGAITTLVIGIITAVDWATSAYLSQLRVALAIDALVTIVLGVVLHRTLRAMETGVDFLIYRHKHEALAYLSRLARTLLRAEREETIDHALVRDPFDKLRLNVAALFKNNAGTFTLARVAGWNNALMSFDREHDLVRFLATERARLHLRDLHQHVTAEFLETGAVPVVAIPIFDGDELHGFALYGFHADGTRLDPDEVDVLERLCETAAQAYIRVENLGYRRISSPVPAPA